MDQNWIYILLALLFITGLFGLIAAVLAWRCLTLLRHMNAKIAAIAETSSGNSLSLLDMQSSILSVKKNVSTMTMALADRLSQGRDECFGAYRIGPYSGFIDKTPDIMEDILADTQQDTKFDRLLDTTPDVFGDSEDVMPVNQN